MLESNSDLLFEYICIKLPVLFTYISAHPSISSKDANLFIVHCQLYIINLLPMRNGTVHIVTGRCHSTDADIVSAVTDADIITAATVVHCDWVEAFQR
jgi:hypothetical protein